ncbi:MOSC domain-containing protein [Paenibacillus allorhizosphaerae]|uniref:MOSC domain-containing protein n=1 Tax=Paenibacillus allorhizosphaerae TaxID=2849866 RepID=A0ABM8VJL0_9BACL|nr:MOSC N-terminal beta barrel domain-containing protein [Paenibacillus allorhizosphaerae]CAG7645108.1 hypothetical protein PAECIP111802_03431 [Paenibacillus allorhizosphaerae]
MSLKAVGEVIEINRYPVKSFAGERLDRCAVERYGLYGDRSYAFIDEQKEGWDRFITARTIPAMLAYKARLTGGQRENDSPAVLVAAPDEREFTWNEELLKEMQTHSRIKMSMMSYSGERNDDLMAVDTGEILIITDAALRKLEAQWGKPVDHRRFRANIVVALADHSFGEDDWIGKRLSVGTAGLQVDAYCERCSMISIDPDTLERDHTLLKKVNEEMNLNFGVYASVTKTGEIQVGEKVYLS